MDTTLDREMNRLSKSRNNNTNTLSNDNVFVDDTRHKHLKKDNMDNDVNADNQVRQAVSRTRSDPNRGSKPSRYVESVGSPLINRRMRPGRCSCRSTAQHALHQGEQDERAEYLQRRSLSPFRMVKDPIQPAHGSFKNLHQNSTDEEMEALDELPSMPGPHRPRASTCPDSLQRWRQRKPRLKSLDRPPSPISPRRVSRTWSKEQVNTDLMEEEEL